MPEPKKHYEQRGAIETVLRYLPGFRGYLEREYRRESDELQRQWLADRLQRSKRGLNDYAQELAAAVQLEPLNHVEKLRARLDRLIGRIGGAMQGYSGFFDLVQIDVPELERLYEYDVALMERVAKLADDIEQLADNTANADQSLRPLLEQVEELQDAWDLREDMLKGLE